MSGCLIRRCWAALTATTTARRPSEHHTLAGHSIGACARLLVAAIAFVALAHGPAAAGSLSIELKPPKGEHKPPTGAESHHELNRYELEKSPLPDRYRVSVTSLETGKTIYWLGTGKRAIARFDRLPEGHYYVHVSYMHANVGMSERTRLSAVSGQMAPC